MRIGLFTDTYRPSINGIVYVVESLKRYLEADGHEVYVFCPAKSIRPSRHASLLEEDDHIIRFPSLKGAFYEDYDTSLFFPIRVLSQIKDLELDIIHVFTPGQVGLMGIQGAWRTKTPFVIQHCTDIYEFVEHYPAVLPGALALVALVVPFTVRLHGKDVRELIKLYRPRRGATEWNQDIIEKAVTIVYSKADAVITLSRKSTEQLAAWQKDEAYRYPLTLMPSGVPPVPRASAAETRAFRQQWDIAPDDEVFGFVGRLAEEKNLPLLIKACEKVVKVRPQARLLFVGDFEYRQALEEMAAASRCADRITFTGAIPRDQLGAAYKTMDIFTFPSLKDTQGWAIHEAAHAGLPIILVDPLLSEVVINEENGLIVRNNPTAMSRAIVELLADPDRRAAYGKRSRQLAGRYTESRQIRKLIRLYESIVD